MPLFKKEPVKEPVKAENSTDTSANTELQNQIATLLSNQQSMANDLKGLREENETLKNQNKATELNNKLEGYATKFGVESTNLDKDASTEEKLWNLLESASKQIEGIKNTITDKPVGDLATENLIQDKNKPNEKPVTQNEAMVLSAKEKPELKGAELVLYAENKFPDAFNVKNQINSLKGE